jgi:hypothetical protein
VVAPNFGDDGSNKNGDSKNKPFINFNHPIFGWMQIPVKSWSFTTLKMPKGEFDGMSPIKSSKPYGGESIECDPDDLQKVKNILNSGKNLPIAKSIDEMIKAAIKKYQEKVLAGLDEDAELKNHPHDKHYGESPLAKLSSSSEDYQSFLKKACENIANGFGVPGLGKTKCVKSPSNHDNRKQEEVPSYLRKLYSRIDRQREQATVHLANHKPSRERIVYDAIVTNESGNRVVEPIELFVVSGRAGRVTFARPLAYLRSPFRIEDNSIRGDLRKLNLDGVYVTTDPANAEVVESMVDELSAGVRFAIYERNVGDELRLEAALRLGEGGYVLPERGEFDGGEDSWKGASERFWALLERVYWECVAVVGGSEVN